MRAGRPPWRGLIPGGRNLRPLPCASHRPSDAGRSKAPACPAPPDRRRAAFAAPARAEGPWRRHSRQAHGASASRHHRHPAQRDEVPRRLPQWRGGAAQLRRGAEAAAAREPLRRLPARLVRRAPGFSFRGTEIAAMLDGFLDSLAARAGRRGASRISTSCTTISAPSRASELAGPGRRRQPVVPRAARPRRRRDPSGAGQPRRLRGEPDDRRTARGYHRQDELSTAEEALRLRVDLRAAGQEMRAILAARDFVRHAFRGHADIWNWPIRTSSPPTG